jgi:FKBP12-rapamycin complex-associated protein
MAQQMMNHLRQAADTAAMSTLEFDYSSSAMSLLDQAMTVSEELIRIAITKHEAWHEALEEASKLFFIEHNIDAMIRLLEPLHSAMEKVPETTLEASFYQLYGAPLAEAWSWCLQYAETGSFGSFCAKYAKSNVDSLAWI